MVVFAFRKAFRVLMMMEVGEDGIAIIHDVSYSLSQTLSCTVLLETFIFWN